MELSANLNKEKLKWRSRRSMLELDLQFEKFINQGGLDKLSDVELRSYSQLLNMDDGDLVLLLQGKSCSVELNDIQQLLIEQIRGIN